MAKAALVLFGCMAANRSITKQSNFENLSDSVQCLVTLSDACVNLQKSTWVFRRRIRCSTLNTFFICLR